MRGKTYIIDMDQPIIIRFNKDGNPRKIDTRAAATTLQIRRRIRNYLRFNKRPKNTIEVGYKDRVEAIYYIIC